MGEMLGSDSCSGDDEVSEDAVADESPLQRCLLAAKILLGRAAADNIFADNEWQPHAPQSSKLKVQSG